MLKIRRALISVYDKKNVLKLAEFLNDNGVEIVSTGGTYKLLKENNIPVKEVSSVTGFPEIMHGRVKTLHPVIHGGLLADKSNKEHMEQIEKLNIKPFDMVVVNLYPFEEMLKKKLSFEEMVEYIDIGGPTMLRAAAKNMNSVLVMCKPEQYTAAIKEMKKNKGEVSEELCKNYATEVFNKTFQYDMAVSSYLSGVATKTIVAKQEQSLRYGENPHQKAGFYKSPDIKSEFKQLNGKELSYNNMLDMDAAIRLALEFKEPFSAVVKHNIPCGAAIGKNAADAYVKAYLADPTSSFGGIISFNVEVDGKTAKAISDSGFREVVAAPKFSKQALAILTQKPNLRVIEFKINAKPAEEIKKTLFGYLVQEEDTKDINIKELKTVTKKKPTDKQIVDLLFAWKICKHVKSNAIVVAKDGACLGIGGGFTARVDAAEYAYKKALKSTKGAVVASDAFFPHIDNVQVAAQNGITAVIQPGGSVKDPDVIAECDKEKIAMVFTGMRHFRH